MEKKENVVVSSFVGPVEIKETNEIKENINKAREEFLKTHIKTQRTSKIISGVFFALTIAFVILGNYLPKLLGVSFGVICAALVGVWFFTRKQKKVIDVAIAKYLYVYSLYCNSYVFDEVNDLQIGYKEKPNVEDVKKINISDEITTINSRDVVKGKIEGREFTSADVSLKTGNPKKEREQKTLFVGRIFELNYSFKDEGRTFVHLKGCGDAAPTKLNDVNTVDVNGLKKEWEVYSSHKNYQKIFNSNMLKILNKISCNNTLNDLVISIVEDKVLIGFSYSDEAMIIPMNKDFEINHLEVKKENFVFLMELNKVLLENSEFKK